MKTKEEKAQEYAMRYFPPKENSDPNAALRHTLEEVYLAGYTEAMKWRDPKEELPEEYLNVFVKVEKRYEWDTNTLYATSMVVNDSFHNKNYNPFECEGYFTSMRGGREKIKVIGWKYIE